MTSGNFQSRLLSSLHILPNRQRKDLGDVNSLAESMQRIGLINPIVIDSSGAVIAGERRFTAACALGWTSISCQDVTNLSDYELQCIEFEENVKRKNLTWQEEVAAIENFHNLKLENEIGWDQVKTAEALGLSTPIVSRQLAVAKEMGNEKIAGADKFTAAHNLVARSLERRKTSALSSIGVSLAKVAGEEAVIQEKSPVPIINGDFHAWIETYSGPKFNLIHCDFPYGINVANSPRQNAAMTDYYDDSKDIYDHLLIALGACMDTVIAESAHLLFWFSMDYYEETRKDLIDMGWTVNPFPLIWHKSDNAGIAPDPHRWPRRTYETAFICSRGDRKLTEAGCKSNSFSYPGKKGDDAIHISEKPVPMLSHFLSMFCDEYTLFLDPTCGSGNSVKAAIALRANHVLGIEIDKDFYDIAVEHWDNA